MLFCGPQLRARIAHECHVPESSIRTQVTIGDLDRSVGGVPKPIERWGHRGPKDFFIIGALVHFYFQTTFDRSIDGMFQITPASFADHRFLLPDGVVEPLVGFRADLRDVGGTALGEFRVVGGIPGSG
jgi:hypothetical protein